MLESTLIGTIKELRLKAKLETHMSRTLISYSFVDSKVPTANHFNVLLQVMNVVAGQASLTFEVAGKQMERPSFEEAQIDSTHCGRCFYPATKVWRCRRQ